jgi:hypothetical protein
MDNYYTPNKAEFTQGFKFERLERLSGDKIGSVLYLDEEYNKEHGKELFADKDLWLDFEVFWEKEPEWNTTKYGDIYIASKPLPEFDWYPWIKEGYIEQLIKDGKVRAKRSNEMDKL